MLKKKRSVIWKIPRNKIIEIYNKSNSVTEMLLYFGLKDHGNNYLTLKSRLEYENISYGDLAKKGKESTHKRISLFSKKNKLRDEEIFIEGSNYNRGWLKKRIIENKLLKNECEICKIGTEWNGKELVLVLDHINGINNDNRLVNLRLVCPNCNSQLETFCGKHRKKIYYCEKCGKEKRTKESKKCRKCLNSEDKEYCRKVINRPGKEELSKMIGEISWCAIGREYGVSDNTVRKWAKKYNII